MEVLVLGGTRNLGPALVDRLIGRGHRVAVCNRGVTPDDLPATVERLRADRRDRAALARALGGRRFDAVIDTTLYDGAEAGDAVALLSGRTGHYVFVSSGQVYLVREGVERPFAEEDFDGPVMPAPAAGTPDFEEWSYGTGKRAAEEVFLEAAGRGFPVTALRLPMVHGERDHHHRLHGYVARLLDGGPILVPEGPHLPIRHVDAADVVRAIVALVESGAGKGRAFNLAQEETAPIEECLGMLAASLGRTLRLARVPRERLVEASLLPACSPFSGLWMSELDNRRSKEELGVTYTPFAATLHRLARHYREQPPPPGYARRPAELALAG